MTHKTKGIVLRAIRYGETSLVVTVFTEVFGIQTYMVNGVRSSKKSGTKAVLYQPPSLLDMIVYHQDQKQMHRIKEASWSFLYNNILTDVIKNSIAVFITELIHKTLKQPEANADLFYFCEDMFQQLDDAPPEIAANFPLYCCLHLTHFFGFQINDIPPELATAEHLYLDLVEGNFTDIAPTHPHFLEKDDALISSELLRIMQPHELNQIKLNKQKRRQLLHKYLEYYSLHITDFGQIKTLRVLEEVLS
jgi:DNA repair protein RecO (recombination protein O)